MMCANSSMGPLEIVFSFDTTGSMGVCLEIIRNRLQELIQRLQGDIPGIRIAVCAHADYDPQSDWVTKWFGFTTDGVGLCKFIKTVPTSGSIDLAECYELVLREAQTKLSWTPGSRRCLVLFGDDLPHEADYRLNKDKIDWRQEAKELARHGVTIYGVHCRADPNVGYFYKTISEVTGGKYLRLEDFGNLFDLLMAVSYKESNETAMLAAYEKEVRARQGHAGISLEVENVFAVLQSKAIDQDGESPHSSKHLKHRPSCKSKSASFCVSSTKSLKPIKGIRLSRLERTKRLSQYHEKRLPLLRRENVYEKNFLLSHLTWSPWILVLSPEKPDVQGTVWKKRQGPGKIGFRLQIIKRRNNRIKLTNGRCKVLFEVAVNTPTGRRQRHVVYSSFSTRCLNNASWERCLLHAVRGQVERLLRGGCHVFLRYSVLATGTDPSPLRNSLGRYDYAWKKLNQIRNCARNVTKSTFPISVTLST